MNSDKDPFLPTVARALSRWRFFLAGALREVAPSILTTVFLFLALKVAGMLLFPEQIATSKLERSDSLAILVIVLAVGHVFCSQPLRKPLAFLSGVPSRPLEVFSSRILLVWIAALLLILIDYSVKLGFAALLETSVSKPSRSGNLPGNLLSSIAFVFLATGLALGLSSLRAGFIFGVLIWIVGGYLFPAPLKHLFALQLTDGFSKGGQSGFHFGNLSLQLSIAFLGYWLGFIKYQAPNREPLNLRKWLQRHLPIGLAKRIVQLIFAGIVLLTVITLGILSRSDPRTIKETERFQYSYIEEDSQLIEKIAKDAETELSEMSRRFKLDQSRIGKITVFMTDTFDDSGAGGVAFWKSMRLSRGALSGKYDFYKPEDVFRHELAHVLTAILCEGTFKRHGVKTKAFNEGLATFMENSDHPNELNEFQSHRLLSAIIREEWYPLPLDQLLAFEGEVLKKHGVHAAYQHGFIMIQAMVDAFGDDAPFTVAQASTRLERKTVLYNGDAFWQTLLHEAGFNYVDLEVAYLRRIEKLKQTYSPEIEAMPIPKPEVKWTDRGCEIFHAGKQASGDATFVIQIEGISAQEEADKEASTDEVLSTGKQAFRANSEGIVFVPAEKFDENFNRRFIAGWAHPKFPTPVVSQQGKLPRPEKEATGG